MSEFKNIFKSKSFWGGLIVGAFLIWIVFVREPFLTSKEDKGSYAYGQQMGKNLKKGFIDYDSRIVRMGMDHAAQGHSKVPDQELQSSLQYLSQKSMPLRQKALAEQPPAPNTAGQVDEFGFTETPFQFSYLKSTWKDFIQQRQDTPGFSRNKPESEGSMDFNLTGNDPEQIFSFVLSSYDSQDLSRESKPSLKKVYKLTSKELPETLRVIISAMKPNETWLVKIKSPLNVPPTFSWPQNFSEGQILEVRKK